MVFCLKNIVKYLYIIIIATHTLFSDSTTSLSASKSSGSQPPIPAAVLQAKASKNILTPEMRKRSLFYTIGQKEEFQTIQSAIDEAHVHGGGTIYLEPGDYYEDLTFYPGITLEGCGIADLGFVCIHGKHSLPESGELGFNHILFSNETSIFKPTIATGVPNLLFRSCVFTVKNGYVLDIPDLNGTVIFFDCCSTGENNGFINNIKGNCEPTLFNMTIDGGKRENTMFVNSKALLFNLHIKVKIEFSGKNSLATINGGTWLEDTVFVRNRAILKIAGCNLETEGNPSCFVEAGCLLTLDNCSLESSANEVIQGSGSVRIGNVSFPLQSNISSTIDILRAAEFYETTKKVGSKGDADALPLTPAGYLITNVNGTECLIPYYTKP